MIWPFRRNRKEMPVVSTQMDADDTCPIVKPVAAPARQHVELGTINYVNVAGGHGDIEKALSEAKRTGKPIFANFVEFPG